MSELFTWVALAAALTTPGLRVRIENAQGGSVGCTLFLGPEGFPAEPARARAQKWCDSAGLCDFGEQPNGTYAVACFLDENHNQKLDTGMFGIPKEPTVISRYARGKMGPPRFDDAKFDFTGQLDLSLDLKHPK